MKARIYQPSRNAMQSGEAKTHHWVLEFSPGQARKLDPLMGWTSSGDMDQQVKLTFESRDAAIAYARKHDIEFQLTVPNKRSHILRRAGYGDNFAHDRKASWTH